MTDDLASFFSSSLDFGDCFSGDIFLSSDKLDDQGSYLLHWGFDCFGDIDVVSNGAKKVVFQLEKDLVFIGGSFSSDNPDLGIEFRNKGDFWLGDVDASKIRGLKFSGDKIGIAGNIFAKILIATAGVNFKCFKGSVLNTSSLSRISLGDHGEISCDIISGDITIAGNSGADFVLSSDSVLYSAAGRLEIDLPGARVDLSGGIFSKGADIVVKGGSIEVDGLGKEEVTAKFSKFLNQKLENANIFVLEIAKFFTGSVTLKNGAGILNYDTALNGESNLVFFMLDERFSVDGYVKSSGTLRAFNSDQLGNFEISFDSEFTANEVHLNFEYGKIEGAIRAESEIELTFANLDIGKHSGRGSKVISNGDLFINLQTDDCYFGHYGILASKGVIEITGNRPFYNAHTSQIICNNLSVMVRNAHPVQIWGLVYVNENAYFGSGTGQNVEFLPGSVVYLNNYQMGVSAYKFLDPGPEEHRAKLGKVRCIGCKFYRLGHGNQVSEMETLMFEISGIDHETLRELGGGDLIAGMIAGGDIPSKGGMLEAQWHDDGVTKLNVGQIKQGAGASIYQSGEVRFEIPTDVKYYLNGNEEFNPKLIINKGVGSIGAFIDGNKLNDGLELGYYSDENKMLPGPKTLLLPGAGVHSSDLGIIIEQGTWAFKRCEYSCSVLLKGKNFGLKPLVYFAADEDREIREYIKFPFDLVGFLEALGFSESGDHWIIGDGQYLYKALNQLAYDKLGLFIEKREALLNTLSGNALWEYSKNDSMRAGKPLTKNQQEKLDSPIIWPVWQTIGGRKCLNFKLYYSQDDIISLDTDKFNLVLLDSDLDSGADSFNINPEMKLVLKDSNLMISGHMVNRGFIEAIGSSFMKAKSVLQINHVGGRGEFVLEAEDKFVMELLTSVATRYYGSSKHVTTEVLNNARVDFTGDILIKSGDSLTIKGGKIKSDKLLLESGDETLIIPVEIYNSVHSWWGGRKSHGSHTKESLENELAEIFSRGGIQIISKGDNKLYAPKIKSGGVLSIDSVLGQNHIESVLNKYQEHSYRYKKGNFFHSSKRYSSSNTHHEPIGAEINSDGFEIRSAKDSLIAGAQISANWVTTEVGKDGQGSVILLPSREVNLSIDSFSKKGVFKKHEHMESSSSLTLHPTVIHVEQECKKDEGDKIKCSGGYFIGYAQNQFLQLSSVVEADKITIKAPRGIKLEAASEIEEHYSYDKKKRLGIGFNFNPGELAISIGARIDNNQHSEYIEKAKVSVLKGKTIILETEETFYEQGASIHADEELKITSKIEIHDVAYNKLTKSSRSIRVESGLKLGIQSSLGGLIESGKQLSKSKVGSTEQSINTAFTAYETLSIVADIASSGSLFKGGAWFYAKYAKSTAHLDQVHVVASVIKAGTYTSQSEKLKFKSTQIEAFNAYFLSDKLTIEAASSRSDFRQKSKGGDIQIPIGESLKPNAGADIAKLAAGEVVPFDATIYVHNKLQLNIRGEANIKGASISANSLEAAFKDLLLESVQELSHNKGYNFGLSSGLSKKELLSGIRGETSKEKRNIVSRLTEMVGRSDATVIVAHSLYLTGAVIASSNEKDGGLELTFGELFIKHIHDYDNGRTLGASFSLGRAASQDDKHPFSNKYKVVFGGKDGEGFTRASIIGGECASEDCAGVNQDPDKVQDFNYRYKIETIRATFIDPKEVAAKLRQGTENIKSGKFFEQAWGSLKGSFKEVGKPFFNYEDAHNIENDIAKFENELEQEQSLKPEEKEPKKEELETQEDKTQKEPEKKPKAKENNSPQGEQKGEESSIPSNELDPDKILANDEELLSKVESLKEAAKEDKLNAKPKIEFFIRGVEFTGKQHGYTIFTFSDGSRVIITSFPDGDPRIGMITGNLKAVIVSYDKNNYDKELFPKGDWKDNESRKLIQSWEIENDHELNLYLLRAARAVDFVNTGNNGGRFDYDLCVTDKCWGANSNTVQKLLFETMELELKSPKDDSLPGINGKFYDGFLDDYFKKLGAELQKEQP